NQNLFTQAKQAQLQPNKRKRLQDRSVRPRGPKPGPVNRKSRSRLPLGEGRSTQPNLIKKAQNDLCVEMDDKSGLRGPNMILRFSTRKVQEGSSAVLTEPASVMGEKELMINMPLPDEYIEEDEEALETSFESLETVVTTRAESEEGGPKLSRPSIMKVKVLIRNGFQPGKGLGKELEGIAEPVALQENP
ncbi:hypothetical protein CR513_57230, partial [Mucuna pruriens]